MNSVVTRTITGILFLAVMIGCLLGGRYLFLPLFLFIQVQMLHEFYQMTLGSRHKAIRCGAIGVSMAALVLVALVSGPQQVPSRFLSLLLLLLTALLGSMVFAHKDFKDNAYILSGLLYIGLPLALSPLVVSLPGGGYSGLLMLSFFIIIWSSDVGAYCFGMVLGQKVWPAKMCPEISPKKSWAGFIGGLLTSLLTAWILYSTPLLGSRPLLHVLVMAALIHVSGVLGDLFESLWKRHFGIKDSSNILPGHGGLLDRFDSSLFAIPTAYVYLVLFELL